MTTAHSNYCFGTYKIIRKMTDLKVNVCKIIW